MIHAQNNQLPLYNLLNHMLFSVPGLQKQDDIKHQIDNLTKINTPQLLKWSKILWIW